MNRVACKFAIVVGGLIVFVSGVCSAVMGGPVLWQVVTQKYGGAPQDVLNFSFVVVTFGLIPMVIGSILIYFGRRGLKTADKDLPKNDEVT